MSNTRIHLNITGIVQGVGFRPFLHRLSTRFSLSGWARNTSDGVELEAEGEDGAVGEFVSALTAEAPPLAVLDAVEVTRLPDPAGYEGFRILESETRSGRQALVSPDVGICPDCLRELNDPANRRYRYPFLNCTNCGPRFTIVKDIPYDRPLTSMANFPMCPSCAGEYRHIENRRYHAQPTCCPTCGPTLSYLDSGGKPCEGDPLELARQALERGEIIAVKGLGGFHLACLPRPDVIQALRRRKGREEKPFALMCADLAAARALCHISPEEERALTSWRRPIVLLRKRSGAPAGLSENADLGVMLPYTPLHCLLMEGFDALVMTSANPSDLPAVIDNREAATALDGIADGFLTHNRDIITRCDDSLIRVFQGIDYPLRRSRGYAPQPLNLKTDLGNILACGGEQKASFVLSRGEQAFFSQHIGDVKNIQTLTHYEEQIAHFERLFSITPAAIACDLHPDYLTTRYARSRSMKESLPLIPVQHHHAHMVSCMEDNGLAGPCIGLIWDGTGYGTDGSIWGGECLVGDAGGFTRVASLRPIPLPGGDLCTREIDRTAHALLFDCSLPSTLTSQRADFLTRQLTAGLNCPASSGIGRLFDGVLSLLTGRATVTYEGQGAIQLETIGEPTKRTLPLSCYEEDGILRGDFRPMLTALMAARQDGAPPGELAAAFMDWLVELGRTQCRRARTAHKLTRVVLSGGVFQNMYLLPRLISSLERDGFAVYHHSRVSTNDEGIALGQLAIAAAQLRKERR